MKASSVLIEIATRHQVHVERLKSHDARAFDAFLKRMDADLRKQLAAKELTEFSRARLQAQIKVVREALKDRFAEFEDVWRKNVMEFAKYESKFEAKALGQIVPAQNFTLPSTSQLQAAVFTSPLSVKGPDEGKLLEPFVRDWSARMVDRVEGAIRIGYAQGQTTNQILQRIRGTRAGNFRDGILRNFRDGAEAMVRTSVQHAASMAREAVWQQNADLVKKVRWVSTLDSRTTQQCQALDGREFPLTSGPRPPAHINCRSTVVAVMDERYDFLDKGATRAARDDEGNAVKAPAKQTYYEWLKKQSPEMQRSALGPTRAKLFNEGGLSAERFAELSLDKNFMPLTLDEMEKLEPVAFARAGLL